MKKNNFLWSVFAVSFVVLLMLGQVFGAWDPDAITNSTKFKYWPGMLKDNFEAIENSTDASLQITNAKVSATAGIVDTKLATISSAGKVSATALTGLASTPSGAGALPIANGGTAATSAAAARASLNAAALGANSDITSLAGLTTPLSVAQGGTGSATKNFLDLTTNQTVAGIKTLSSFLVTPSSAPATDYQVSNKKYVDDTVAAIVTSPSLFISGFGGDGSDGAGPSTTDTIAAGSVMQYSSWTVNGSNTITAQNCFIAVQGTLTINGAISANGGGGAGGTSSSAVGGSVDSALQYFSVGGGGGGGGGASQGTTAGGVGGTSGGAGGSAAGISAGGDGSAASSARQKYLTDLASVIHVAGSYGGGGGAGSNASHGDGGNGGGFIYIECGTLVLNSGGSVTANGLNGATAGAAFSGSGGGGGGGLVIIKAKTITTNDGTVTASGGSGGSSGTNIYGGGNGAAGFTAVIDIP